MVPYWKSASFMHWVLPNGVHLAGWARRFLKFRPSGFICDQFVDSSTFKGVPSFDVLVIEFDFFGVDQADLWVCSSRRELCLNERNGSGCFCHL